MNEGNPPRALLPIVNARTWRSHVASQESSCQVRGFSTHNTPLSSLRASNTSSTRSDQACAHQLSSAKSSPRARLLKRLTRRDSHAKRTGEEFRQGTTKRAVRTGAYSGQVACKQTDTGIASQTPRISWSSSTLAMDSRTSLLQNIKRPEVHLKGWNFPNSGSVQTKDAAFRTYKELTWYTFCADVNRHPPAAVHVHNLEHGGEAPRPATQPAGQLFALQNQQGFQNSCKDISLHCG
jgi:hypothetical protein